MMSEKPRFNRDGTLAMPEGLSEEEWVKEVLYRRRCLFRGYHERSAGPCNPLGMPAGDVLDSLGDGGDALTPLELAVLCLHAGDGASADAVLDSADIAGRALDVFDPEHVHEAAERLADMGLFDRNTGSDGVDRYSIREDAYRRMKG